MRSSWVAEEAPAPDERPVGLPVDARYQGAMSASMQAYLASLAALERRSCAGHPAHPGRARAVHVYTVDRPLEQVREQMAANLARVGARDAGAGAADELPPIRTTRLHLGEPAELARLSEESGTEWPTDFVDRYRAAFPRLRDAVGSMVVFEVDSPGSLPDSPWSADVHCFTIRLLRPYLDLETLRVHDRTAVQYIVAGAFADP